MIWHEWVINSSKLELQNWEENVSIDNEKSSTGHSWKDSPTRLVSFIHSKNVLVCQYDLNYPVLDTRNSALHHISGNLHQTGDYWLKSRLILKHTQIVQSNASVITEIYIKARSPRRQLRLYLVKCMLEIIASILVLCVFLTTLANTRAGHRSRKAPFGPPKPPISNKLRRSFLRQSY